MRVLLDTNIMLDVILARPPFLADSERVWQANDERQIAGYITATSVTNSYYIVRKQVGLERARAAIDLCLQAFDICEVDRPTLEATAALAGNDFEDDLQQVCALYYKLNAIVTRDKAGFKGSNIPALTPSELLAQLDVPS